MIRVYECGNGKNTVTLLQEKYTVLTKIALPSTLAWLIGYDLISGKLLIT